MKPQYYLLAGVLFIASCQPFSFKPVPSGKNCGDYISTEGTNDLNPFPTLIEEKGYFSPCFHPTQDQEIVFIQQDGELDWKLLQLNLDTQDTVSLLQVDTRILSFDVSPLGKIAYSTQEGLFIQNSLGSQQPTSVREDAINARWVGENLMIQEGVVSPKLYTIDSLGNIISEFIPHRSELELSRNIAWNVSGDYLLVDLAEKDYEEWHLFIYELASFQLIDSFDLFQYPRKQELSLQVSSNRISLDMDDDMNIAFSYGNQLYLIDPLTKEGVSLWERDACVLLEPGISFSDSGESLVAGCSRITQNPSFARNGGGEKKMGLMLLDDGFSRQTADFP